MRDASLNDKNRWSKPGLIQCFSESQPSGIVYDTSIVKARTVNLRLTFMIGSVGMTTMDFIRQR